VRRCVNLIHCKVVEVPDSEALVNGFDVVDVTKEAAANDSNTEKCRTRFCAHSREVRYSRARRSLLFPNLRLCPIIYRNCLYFS